MALATGEEVELLDVVGTPIGRVVRAVGVTICGDSLRLCIYRAHGTRLAPDIDGPVVVAPAAPPRIICKLVVVPEVRVRRGFKLLVVVLVVLVNPELVDVYRILRRNPVHRTVAAPAVDQAWGTGIYGTVAYQTER